MNDREADYMRKGNSGTVTLMYYTKHSFNESEYVLALVVVVVVVVFITVR